MGADIGIRNGIRSAFRNSEFLPGTGNSGDNKSLFLARVSFVLLDDSNKEKFAKYGGWSGLGSIECTPFINNHDTTDVIVAVPVTSNLNIYPVLNEIVVIVSAISPYAQGDTTAYDPKYYYSQILSAWNQPEQNAVPNKDWASKDGISVTGLFNPTGKVSKVIKAPGDITLEGRSGNSIRMGSSIKNFAGPFNGPDRSPVLTIVNRYKDLSDYKVGTYEDVNLDGSSFYMLNGHNVNFIASSINFDSYSVDITKDVAPTQPSEKTNYVTTIPEKEPEKALENSVDTIPETKPVLNPVNSAAENKKSVIAGDDTELEDRAFPEEFFTLDEIGDFVDLKEVSEVANVKESDLPSNESDVPASTVYTNSTATNKLKWELQEGKTWCYIASISMLLKSYNIPVSQSNIYQTSVIKGGKYNGNLNSQKAAKTYQVSYSKTVLPDGKTASYNTILQTIRNRNGKPFILERKGISSKSHFVVVVGVNSQNRIAILDPASREYKNGTYLSIDNLKESGGTLRFFDK